MRTAQILFGAAAIATASASFTLSDIETLREGETPPNCIKAFDTKIPECSSFTPGAPCPKSCATAIDSIASDLADACEGAFASPGSLLRYVQARTPLSVAVCRSIESDGDDKDDDKDDEEKPEKTTTAASAKPTESQIFSNLPPIERPAQTTSVASSLDLDTSKPTPVTKKEEELESVIESTTSVASAAKGEKTEEASMTAASASGSTEAELTAKPSASASAAAAGGEDEEDDKDSAAGRVAVGGVMGLVMLVGAWML